MKYLERKMTYSERNRLIADFMGLVFNDDANEYYSPDGFFVGLDLTYDTSWDWLMPVVEKCYQCNYEEGDLHMRLNDALLTVHIAEVYKAVVEFIHWHNYEESKKRLESHRCDIISRIVEEGYLPHDQTEPMNEDEAIAYVDKHDYLVHRSIQLGLNPFDTIDMIDRLTNKDK